MTRYRRQHALLYGRNAMALDDKAKEALKFVQDGYDKAEEEVDGFFVRNKYTALIMAAVAVALVVFLFN